MKQILQDMSSGATTVVTAPAPTSSRGHVLVATRVSLISAGTERMLVDFGKASLVQKARQQPEKVRMVLDKVRTDGLMTTVDAVRSKLGQPLPLGYCNVGLITDVGAGVEGLRAGDRVVSNGPHADIVKVPRNLCARIPETVSDDAASFTVVASIGLQGIRLVQPTLGEAVVVTGAGLIGLLTIQLLRAHGCRVMAVDFDEKKLELARSYGAETCNPARGEDVLAAGMSFSRGRGVDAVIVTASTASSDPITQAAQMSRKRGRIVLVGVTGLELNRADFYEKELSFQVSCSYGPGRYDPAYEGQGQDYPFGFVRWTEQRNFEAVLDMMASGQLDVGRLITHRFAFEEAPAAYQALTDDRSAIGILLKYESPLEDRLSRRVRLAEPPAYAAGSPVVGVVGAGNYASRVLIPSLKAAGANLHAVVTSGGVSGAVHGARSGFVEASTEVATMLADATVNTVVVVTRHDSHASLVTQALRAGKHVFVEKPLAIRPEELESVREAFDAAHASAPTGGPQLMVGFNRRFAPQIVKVKALLDTVRAPRAVLMTVNAGAIPKSHWTQDPEVGGGRIIGEACHFIDLARFLVGSPISSVAAQGMGGLPENDVAEDKASITLTFEDGSFATILYLANGAASFPKERVEVFTAGRVLQLDNFRRLSGHGWSGFSKLNLWRQDKGQAACAQAFLESVRSGRAAIPTDEIFEVARVTIEAARQLREHPGP